jgi:predicted ATPase
LPPSSPLLLERDGELGAIDLAIAQAAAGRGALVVVEGPPGAGTSSLLAAARERAAAGRMLVLGARGSTLEREFGFGVARQLFEALLLRASPAERAELLDDAAAAAGPVVGVIAPPVDRASAIAADGVFEALHGLSWLTANIAARRPLLLVVDDLQWCDAASLRWLAYLVRRIEDLPLLIVMSAHPEEPGAPAALLAEATSGARFLRPAPLGPASVAVMVRERSPPSLTTPSASRATR